MTHISNRGPVTTRPASTEGRTVLVTEALAYVGGLVLVAGVILIAARYWPELHARGRLAIAGLAAIVVLCGAAAVPAQRPAGRRLRVAIWLTSTATAALFFGLLGGDVLGWRAMDTTLLAGVGTSLYATLLWLWSSRVAPLQLALLVATLVAAGAMGAHLDPLYWPGLAVWFAALEWFLLGHGELVPSRRPTLVAAAVGMFIGVGLMMPLDIGLVLGLGTVAGLIGYAVRQWDLALVLVGAVGTLQVLPIAVTEWFPGRLAAPAALLIVGIALVGTAIVMTRRTSTPQSADLDRPSPATIDAARYDAVLFDLDGVVTDTASVHSRAWQRLFDEYLGARPGATAEDHSPFTQDDYRRFVDGISRYDGVRTFLASRGIETDDATARELGDRKDRYFLDSLHEEGVTAFPGTLALIEQLDAAGLTYAVISASRNCAEVLTAAGLHDLFDVRVDGLVAGELHLPGKPDPAIFLVAAHRLGVTPQRTVVVEDALAGVEAGRRGGFGLVIGVDRTGGPADLVAHGADLVVTDLAEVAVTPEREPAR